MKKWYVSILGIASLLLLVPSAVRAQAVAAGYTNTHIQAGAGVLFLNNDYTDREVKGISAWADYDFLHYFHLDMGLEAELHFGTIITPDDIGENSYLIGPRFSYRKHKFTGYAKIMVGRGTIINQETNASSSYNIIPAFGGGLEYKVTHKLNIRVVDFELQQWPNFEPNTLSPVAISVGLMYSIR